MSNQHAWSSLATTVAAAKERAIRTFLTGLGVDLAIALSLFILDNANTVSSKAALWGALLALVKTLVTTAASYVLRFLSVPRKEMPMPDPNLLIAGDSDVDVPDTGNNLGGMDVPAIGPGND